MIVIKEGAITWTFAHGLDAEKYDDWAFYRNQFQACAGGGNKAVDFLALSADGNTLWMIEAKDYRQEKRKKDIPLPLEVAQKARDTLAGLAAAAMNGVDGEKRFARRSLKASKVKVVLHLEQPKKNYGLFPRVFDPADIKQKLRNKNHLKSIDPHPKVVEIGKYQSIQGITTK